MSTARCVAKIIFIITSRATQKKRAKHQADEDARMERRIRAERAAEAMIEKLALRGITATLDFDHKYVVRISCLDLIDTPLDPTY